jgi:predicted nucleic acid-binding protein
LARIALDSNILVYLTGMVRVADDVRKTDRLTQLQPEMAKIATLVVPVQAIGELTVVMLRNGYSRVSVQQKVGQLTALLPILSTTERTMRDALALAVAHNLQIWDSVIVVAALEGGCSILLSEDMQHGFTTGDLTIINPLVEPMHPKLAALL